MIIRTKQESVNKTRELNLNRFPEEVFRRGEETVASQFMEKHPFNFYAIRLLDKINYKTNNKLERSKVLEEIAKHEIYSIGVSSFNYVESLILIGDIRIGADNSVWLLASTKDYPYKIANVIPEYNLTTKIFDKKLDRIKGFD